MHRGQRHHVAPAGFGQVAVGGEHADVAAAVVDAELELAGLARPQFEFFAGHQVRGEGFPGALVEAEEVGVLEGHGILQFDQAYHDRRGAAVQVGVELVAGAECQVQLGHLRVGRQRRAGAGEQYQGEQRDGLEAGHAVHPWDSLLRVAISRTCSS
ncbi:hypothetical protein D9M71_725130 [compost metagenome]